MTNKLLFILSLFFCFSLPVFADEQSSDELIYFPPLEIAEQIESGLVDYDFIRDEYISSLDTSAEALSDPVSLAAESEDILNFFNTPIFSGLSLVDYLNIFFILNLLGVFFLCIKR